MRLLFAVLFCILGTVALAQPLMTSTNFASIDFDGDALADAIYLAEVESSGATWAVAANLVTSNPKAEICRLSPSKLFFDQGEFISASSPRHTDYLASLSIYIGFLNEVQDWVYLERSSVDSPGQRLSVILGLRFRVEVDWHYAWLKFVRPDAQLQTLFTLDSYDWNPIPNAPIGAGLAPEVPIQSEWLPDGSALRLSWPAALASWVLESTPNLNPPLVWEPFPSGGTYADVVPEDPGRFFRLRKP